MSDARKWTWEEAWQVVQLAIDEGMLPSLLSYNGDASMLPSRVDGKLFALHADTLREELNELFQGQLLVSLHGVVAKYLHSGISFYDPVAGEWLEQSKVRRVR